MVSATIAEKWDINRFNVVLFLKGTCKTGKGASVSSVRVAINDDNKMFEAIFKWHKTNKISPWVLVMQIL